MFCYIPEVLTDDVSGNLHGFYSLKVVCVTNFTVINEKNHYSLQGCSIIAWLGKFLLIFKNSNANVSYLIFS